MKMRAKLRQRYIQIRYAAADAERKCLKYILGKTGCAFFGLCL